jgi:hypothetical protein
MYIVSARRCNTSSHLFACQAMCAALVMTLFITGAQGAQWSPFWDAVAERPDAKVIDGVNSKGEQTRRIELSSGVSFYLERHGDKITSWDGDTSGHGAVRCAWEIYVAVRVHIDACSPDEDPNLEADLDDALDRVNDFIAENSLVPITKQQLVDAIEQRKQQAIGMLRRSQGDQREQCEADGAAPLVKAMKSTPRDKWVSTLNDLLSVKRPPVMNPCF